MSDEVRARVQMLPYVSPYMLFIHFGSAARTPFDAGRDNRWGKGGARP